MRAVRAARSSTPNPPTANGAAKVTTTRNAVSPEPTSTNNSRPVSRVGPATRAPSLTPTGAHLASHQHAEHLPPKKHSVGGADRTPPEAVIQYKRHEVHLHEELDHIAAEAAIGERKRAAAEEAHEKMMQGQSSMVQINERAMLWWPAILCANFIDSAKIELDFVRAVRALKGFMQPVVRRRQKVLQKRLHREALTKARHAAGVPQPTARMLKEQVQGTFFRDWADRDVETLLRQAKPISFSDGDVIMFDGDCDRIMYILTRGRIKVMIRDKSRGKKRNLQNAKAVIPVDLPSYVGEYAIMTEEPRSATIICESDVDGFFVTADDFNRVLQSFSLELRQRLDQATMARRQQTLEQFFRPSITKVMDIPVFSGWDDAGLQDLRRKLRPLVVETGTVLFHAGEQHPTLYFVGDGTVELVDGKGDPIDEHSLASVGLAKPSVACQGEVIGAFAAFFRYAQRVETATTVGRCELWAIDFNVLFDIAMNFASRLIASRKVLKDQMSRRLLPPPATCFANLAFVKPIVASNIAAWIWSHSGPVLFCDDEVLCKANDRANSIIVVCHGRVCVEYDNRALSGLTERRVEAGKAPLEGSSLHLQPIVGNVPTGVSDSFVVIGWYEFLTQSPHYACTARALSTCECVVINRSTLEDRLPPATMAALESKDVAEEIRKIIASGKFDRLAVEGYVPVSKGAAAAGGGARGAAAAPSYGSKSPAPPSNKAGHLPAIATSIARLNPTALAQQQQQTTALPAQSRPATRAAPVASTSSGAKPKSSNR